MARSVTSATQDHPRRQGRAEVGGSSSEKGVGGASAGLPDHG